jgi:hypothetical protein
MNLPTFTFKLVIGDIETTCDWFRWEGSHGSEGTEVLIGVRFPWWMLEGVVAAVSRWIS